MRDYGVAPLLRRCSFDGFFFAYLAWLIAMARMPQTAPDARWFGELWLGGIVIAIALAALEFATLGHVIFGPSHRRSPKAAPKKLPKPAPATVPGAGPAAEPAAEPEIVSEAALGPRYRVFAWLQAVAFATATFIAGFAVVDINIFSLFDPDAFAAAMKLFNALASPDWDLLPAAILKIIETIYIAFMATALAAPIAFVLGFLAARNIMGGSRFGYGVYAFMRAGFNALRAIEPILWAIIFSVWVGFGAFAGALALMVHSVASLAKQYSEIVETVAEGPIEGIESTGATRLQTIWFAVVPQILMPYVSYTIDRWDINVRMATIIGFVGGGGIGVMLLEAQGQGRWHQVGCVVFVIAIVVWIIDALSAHVRNALR